VILDPATKARLRMIYPDFAIRVIRVYNDVFNHLSKQMKCNEGIRTFEYQAKLYAQGRTAPGPVVTHSQPGDSMHHYGCAVDSCFSGSDPFLAKEKEAEKLWSEYGRFAQAHGLVWGGDFKTLCDRPHVQLTYGLTLKEIKALYQAGGMPGVWTQFDKIRGVQQGCEWNSPYLKVKLVELGQLDQ
jgi:peptidoglycan L-alanyl-D-glutamate endopeptidase CwlK